MLIIIVMAREEKHAKNISISEFKPEEIPKVDDEHDHGNGSCGTEWRGKMSKTKVLQKQKSCCELWREEAWVRRRRRDLCQEESRAVSRSASDCGSQPRGIRDEDLEELRGCIDLGFRFSLDEHHHHQLCNTFPALDLYYAINRHYNVSKSKSSPECSVHESESCGVSPSSPLCDTWKISSPGENSQEVKTKLRHWAQVVACSVRQSC